MIRVLLCSPHLQQPGIIIGGINVWANNILQYQDHIETDVKITPISFDRKTYVSVDTNMFKRMCLGLKDYTKAVLDASAAMDVSHYDVVHVCTSASISLVKDIALLKAAKKRGSKSVVHFHFGRIPQLFQKKNWEWWLLKKAIKLSSVAVVMDQKSLEVLRDYGYENVVYCPNPLSCSTINHIEKNKHKTKRQKGKLLFVGHVLPSKGVYELVEACMRFEGIELHIIGKADEQIKANLLNIANQKKAGDRLMFRGEISHEQVLYELLTASIFVFPSYTEGFPNVILEAMACGCPIVTTSVGAIPEMLDIANGKDSGICVQPKDVDALANGLRKMLEDNDYAAQCAANSIKRVNEMYAVPIVWDKLCNIWRSI